MHRFRMRKSLFLDMVRKITQKNSYFLQRENACGRKGFHPIHKCVVAMRMLAYGSPADSFDDTYRMPESTVLETVKQFARTIISVYESEFLRPPTASELETILQVNEARGFPGMIGSIDCMHWEWSNCLTAWHGQYKGHKGIVVVLNFDCTDGQPEAKGLAFVIRFPVMESWTITHNSDTPVVHKVRDDIIKLS